MCVEHVEQRTEHATLWGTGSAQSLKLIPLNSHTGQLKE